MALTKTQKIVVSVAVAVLVLILIIVLAVLFALKGSSDNEDKQKIDDGGVPGE